MQKKYQRVHVTREDVMRALPYCFNQAELSRYLGITVKTLRRVTSSMTDNEGLSITDRLIKNKKDREAEHNIKRRYGTRKNRDLMDVLEGLVDTRFIGVKEIKQRVISEGFMEECCSHCGYKEQRVVDHKVPLIMTFRDQNKRNWRLENLQLLCYNCYFLHVGDVFEQHQLDALEDYSSTRVKTLPQLDLPPVAKDIVEDEILKLGQPSVETTDYGRLEDKPLDYGDDLISFNKMKKRHLRSLPS